MTNSSKLGRAWDTDKGQRVGRWSRGALVNPRLQ